MAQYRLNAYDADVYIPEFRGLMQYGGQVDEDLRFSPDCMDVETPGGVLQPCPPERGFRLTYNGSDVFFGYNPGPPPSSPSQSNDSPYGEADAGHSRLTTMMSMKTVNVYQMLFMCNAITITEDGRTHTEIDEITAGEEYWFYIFAIDNELYTAALKKPLRDYISEDFESGELALSKVTGTFSRSKWSWCVYELVHTIGPNGTYVTYNAILLSNPEDGLYYTKHGRVIEKPDGLPTYDDAEVKFSHLTLYAERIWGCAGDRIYYSRAYDPLNWSGSTSAEQPEDGAGEIREATFDDDKINSMVRLGNDLIAFSDFRAWKITGTDPSNFYIQEQYGNGTKYPETIAVMDDYVVMLGEHGFVAYDGIAVRPFMKEATYETLRNIVENPSVPDQRPIAIRTKSKYILALNNNLITNYPSQGIYYNAGYRMIVYDEMDRTVNQRTLPELMDFCREGDEAYMVATDSYGHIDVDAIEFDSWSLGRATYRSPQWQTPWITLGRKDMKIGGFEVYIHPELRYKLGMTPVTFEISIETEKKKKTKEYVCTPTFDEHYRMKPARVKRIHFGGGGRRFRLILSAVNGTGRTVWRLVGGIHIIAEIDKD